MTNTGTSATAGQAIYNTSSFSLRLVLVTSAASIFSCVNPFLRPYFLVDANFASIILKCNYFLWGNFHRPSYEEWLSQILQQPLPALVLQIQSYIKILTYANYFAFYLHISNFFTTFAPNWRMTEKNDHRRIHTKNVFPFTGI